MTDYKPNSHKYREEQKDPANEERRVEKVVNGALVKTKKKTTVAKAADLFISEDSKNVGSWILNDMVVPTIKKILLGTLDMILNGGHTDYGRRTNTSNVSYRNYYSDPRDDKRYSSDSRNKTRFDYDDILFPDRGTAEAVLDEMENVINRYGFVTVADLYDMADISNPPYTSNKYGWTSVRSAYVDRTRNGEYFIKLSRAVPID